eukprot:1157218-Pelagomonas_calceolata.AAC.21
MGSLTYRVCNDARAAGVEAANAHLGSPVQLTNGTAIEMTASIAIAAHLGSPVEPVNGAVWNRGHSRAENQLVVAVTSRFLGACRVGRPSYATKVLPNQSQFSIVHAAHADLTK